MRHINKINQTEALQLQFWDSKARAYVPSGRELQPDSQGFIGGSTIEHLADVGRRAYRKRGWRIAKASRALTVPKLRRKAFTAGVRPIDDVQRDYLQWAQAKGLKSIHAYSTKPPQLHEVKQNYRGKTTVGPAFYTGELEWLTPDQQFAVTESHEVRADSGYNMAA